ncbi:hypothetical protein CK203_037235 [Vitis vinifera]|uniref:Uncharacterized protein n=1 Tax=Vitis vinifera TaxID=29760 RepID=A0A438HS76_VITVI|nr:hypothetical protein CK203_037235 [Vitis vinifera]
MLSKDCRVHHQQIESSALMTKNNLQPGKNNNNSRTSRQGERMWLITVVTMDTQGYMLGDSWKTCKLGSPGDRLKVRFSSSIKPRQARNRFFNTTSIYKFINFVQQAQFGNHLALTSLVHSKEPWIIDLDASDRMTGPVNREDDWQF